MKQLSVVIWLDCDDDQLDLIERGLKYLVKGLSTDAQINVIKKEVNINQPKTQ